MPTYLQAKLANYLSLREALGIPTHHSKPLLQKFVEYLDQHINDDYAKLCIFAVTRHIDN